MKTRNDFVSNSSSSSFIVLHSENKFGVLLDEENIHNLTIEEYFSHFGEAELFDWYIYSSVYDENVVSFKYVTAPEFAKLFKEGKHAGVFPEAVKNLNEELIASISARLEREKAANGKTRFDESERKAIELEYALKNDIADQVCKLLKPYFDGETFDYAEVDDQWDASLEELYGDEILCKETLIKHRIQYLQDKLPVTFYRVFCNH